MTVPKDVTVNISRGSAQDGNYESAFLGCLVDRISIVHGRADSDSQPDPAACTVEISQYGTDDELPAVLEIGSRVDVTHVAANGLKTPRFYGNITDISLTWEDAGEATPERLTGEITATSLLAKQGRRVVGFLPWGQELDGARVLHILGGSAGLIDPGTVQILPRDVDMQPALDLARSVADSAGGIVWHDRAGTVRYADALHRRNTPVSVRLDACDILTSPQWRRTTEGLINRVNIAYGPTPEGGEQPVYTAVKQPSVNRYGTFEISASTELAELADATAMGQLLLTRNSDPVWVMAELPVDVRHLDATRTASLVRLDMHSLIELVGLPEAGSAPTNVSLWVEGYSEEFVYGDHTMTLTVSGYCRTSPPPWWDDVPATSTWDSVGDYLWDDVSCLPPSPNTGAWNNVSATTTWHTTNPWNVTWDTWKG